MHFFDLLLWIFGGVKKNTVTLHNNIRAAGELELEKADVNWMLSIDATALPADVRKEGKRTCRLLIINNEAIEFSDGFEELHTKSYEEIITGRGFPISETMQAIDLVHKIR